MHVMIKTFEWNFGFFSPVYISIGPQQWHLQAGSETIQSTFQRKFRQNALYGVSMILSITHSWPETELYLKYSDDWRSVLNSEIIFKNIIDLDDTFLRQTESASFSFFSLGHKTLPYTVSTISSLYIYRELWYSSLNSIWWVILQYNRSILKIYF